jgi:pimeloyl-ACP methyl ester carboxylesterase
VAAFAPASGESTADSQSDNPSQARFEVDSGGFLYLAQESVPQFLAQDLPATDNRVLAAVQQPVRATALFDRVAKAAWRVRPCWYVVTSEDRMIAPELQRRLAARMNARVSILSASHTPFLSKPKETANVILSAVDFVRNQGQTSESIAVPRDRA